MYTLEKLETFARKDPKPQEIPALPKVSSAGGSEPPENNDLNSTLTVQVAHNHLLTQMSNSLDS